MQQQKRTSFSILLVLINRPMLALSVLIHIGLLSIPLPEKTESAAEDIPEEMAADLSQITLASSPLVEETPLAVPTLDPTPTATPTSTPDVSQAPRPPKKFTPTPTPRATATLKPTPTPTPPPTTPEAVVETPSETPPTAATVPPQVPVPTPPSSPETPPPPPVELEDPTAGLSREEVRAQFAEFRLKLRESDSDQVYPALLDQPSAFFGADVSSAEIASQDDCLPLMIYCWWQPLETPRNMLRLLKEQNFLANLAFEEISEGYAQGNLYHLVNKGTGAPTTYYVTLTKPKGATATGTLVGFWTINPRDFVLE